MDSGERKELKLGFRYMRGIMVLNLWIYYFDGMVIKTTAGWDILSVKMVL